MTTALQVHPLQTLMERSNLTATAYLKRVADRHRALGFGSMAYRKEKLSRWTRGGVTPQRAVLLAIASLHHIAPSAVDRLGWPHFLLLALDDDRIVLDAPWTPAGTVEALANMGGHMEDRRGFLIATTSVLAASLGQWGAAVPAAATDGHGRRIGVETARCFDVRLAALRHLDDTVEAGQVYDAARLELRMISALLKDASSSAQIRKQLFGCAAEAARIAGWCAYDAGRHAAAERHFLTSLRASGSAESPTLAAVTLAFWANLRYNAGDPRGALQLLDGALADRRKISSPRVVAMLHARAARAHSKAGDSTATWHEIDQAFATYSKAPAPAEDLPSMYWINHGELHQVAASSAVTLGEPHRALENFAAALTHTDPYDTTREARGNAIYLTRQAEAHLTLGEIDAAVEIGHLAIDAIGGLGSARTADTLAELRRGLHPHRNASTVRDFLDRGPGRDSPAEQRRANNS